MSGQTTSATDIYDILRRAEADIGDAIICVTPFDPVRAENMRETLRLVRAALGVESPI